GRAHAPRDRLLAVQQLDAAAAHGLEMGATRHHRDVVVRRGQFRRDVAADRAGAEDAQFHADRITRMKICRFDDNRLGVVTDEGIRDVSSVLGKLPSATYPFPRHDALVAHLAELRPEMERAARSARAVPLEKVKLLSPLANPGKIIAAPVNYKKHLEE